MSAEPVAPAVSRTYWVEPGRLLAGAYPGHVNPTLAEERVEALLELGVDWFIDLTWPGELPPYDELLPNPYAPGPTRHVTYSRRPIVDHGLPREPAEMLEILGEIEEALAGGHLVYVHCRAGIGRTGTVVGCHLARRLGGAAALEEIDRLWQAAGRDRDYPTTPETDAQAEYVRHWPRDAADYQPVGRHAPPVASAVPGAREVTDRLRDRYRGLVLGLALGDALAAPVQHRRPGTFTAVGDLTGGGPYDLPRGAWSDDTAISAALARSLAERGEFDAHDFVARLARWQRQGEGSATGQCVGISATTAKAVAQAQWSGKPFAGSHDPARAEKEPLVRATVAAAFALSDPAAAVALAAEVARPTHQAPLVLDACRYVAALTIGALRGATRAELVAAPYAPVEGLWQRAPLRREVAALAAGGWRAADGAPPRADGMALEALGVALWALAGGTQYRDTVLAAINLGQDADVHGALVGALAGALAGAQALPGHWLAGLAGRDGLTRLADDLLAAALTRIAAD